MIPFWKVQAIEALLAEDALSQRAIAKRLHVGRGVVTSIANGRRPDYHALRRAAVPVAPASPAAWQRCPQCGALVQLPCLGCRARRAMVHGRRFLRGDLPAAAEGLQVRLIGSERLRYEELCARRQSGDRGGIFQRPVS